VAAENSEKTTPHFYRPELDALRFFAFFCVFVHHGPAFVPAATAAQWKVQLAHLFMLLRAAGGFGMSLFFLLSSYLITELLLREKASTGEVHLKAFYVRRILRIWPLYFFGLGLAIILGIFIPDPYWMNQRAVLAFLLFAVAWIPGGTQTPFNVLWSIGVEEQFYLLWPCLAKFGGARAIRIASYFVIVISFISIFVLAHTNEHLWYNPLVEFLYFAVGALVSLSLKGAGCSFRPRTRILLFLIGLFVWVEAQHIGKLTLQPEAPPAWRDCVFFGLAGIGSVLIFLSILGLQKTAIPKPLLYLGKISYGLYVFQGVTLELTMRWLPRFSYGLVWELSVYAIAMGLTIAIASVTYKFLEMPFLRLKHRFEFVKSRTA
jgi:peptidoglycan/LPS O-acetylase OafA/YrhL